MKPEEFSKLFEQLKTLIVELFFQGQEPSWLTPLINHILLLIVVLFCVWGFLLLLSQIKKVWTENFWPLLYNQAQRKRQRNRQRFADHIEREIRQLNTREEWKDYRFTELEAEVEAEGRRRRATLLPFIHTTQRGLRREQSLSKALEFSSERLILVEGDPGSGKSVALRHVAETLARRAMHSRNIKSTIPLYINLKKLERSPDQEINRDLIETFVKAELNRVNDRDIEQFLDEEFRRGMRQGTWLFLFDSFDELPEILSSVEADRAIQQYAEAINHFLGGFNQCRGIIASRQFRGPKHLGWPRFRILPLESRRVELIRKAELDPAIEKDLIGQLKNAPQDLQDMTKNPMFLGILCENMRDGSPFPSNSHSVFASYLDKRLTRDAPRLQTRFNLQPSDVRAIAETVAFCLSSDPSLGLSPTRQAIQQAMVRLDLRVPGHFEQLLNALEYLKLARSETETLADDAPLFTFAHRRFQEYFATCVVLRDLNRIRPRTLLTDGRWRETAVVIFQTQAPETFTPILAEAKQLLADAIDNIPDLIDDPIGYVNEETVNENPTAPKPFPWLPGLLHLLGLLQAGFIGHMNDLPSDIQQQVGRLLLSASLQGTLLDRKWSLEVAGIAPQSVLLWLLRHAFASDSQWLKEVAYRQTAQLSKIPDDISAEIRRSLLRLFADNRLHKDYFATYAHLSRLDRAAQYINVLRLLRWLGPIDLCLHISVLLCLSLYFSHNYISLSTVLIWIALANPILLLSSFVSLPSFASIVSSIRHFIYEDNFVISDVLFANWKLTLTSAFTVFFRIIFFPLLWSIFAILAANTGQFTRPIIWPLLMSFPLLFIIYNFKKAMEILYFMIALTLIVGIISIPLTFLSFLIAIIKNWLLDSSSSILISIANLVPIILIFMSFLPLITLIIDIFQNLNHWFQDRKKYKKWIKTHLVTMTSQELLNSINLYKKLTFCKKLIVAIREQNILLATEDSEDFLSELARILEYLLRMSEEYSSEKYSLKEARIESMIETYSGSAFFTSWLKQYTRKDKMRLVNLGPEFLDEVYRLLEQIRARRQLAEGAAPSIQVRS